MAPERLLLGPPSQKLPVSYEPNLKRFPTSA